MGKRVLLLHGFASSGNSRKAQYLRERFDGVSGVTFHALDFNPTPADFEYMTVTGMINRLRQHLLEREEPGALFLAGSSLGALVGLNYAHRYGRVTGMLLLAPALSFGRTAPSEQVERVYHFAFERELRLRQGFFLDGAQYADPVPPAAPVTIIHGLHDEVVPIAASRAYAAAHPGRVRLIAVDSDHRLNDQLDRIWEQLCDVLGQDP